MRLFIVFAAIFVILSDDVMSYGLGWYQNLKPDSHEHESYSSESSSSGESSSSNESASHVENSHNNENSPSSESSSSSASSPSSESSPSKESSQKQANSLSNKSLLNKEISLTNQSTPSNESSLNKESSLVNQNAPSNKSSRNNESSLNKESSPSYQGVHSNESSRSNQSAPSNERSPSTESSPKNENSPPSNQSALTNDTSPSNEGSSRNKSSLGLEILFQSVTNNNSQEQVPTTTSRSTAKITTQPTTTPLVTETATDKSRDFFKCVKKCQVTTEYNPVCGTNFVTYTNPGNLNCAKGCGLAVDLFMASPCPPNTALTFSTTRSLSTTTIPKTKSKLGTLAQQQCVNSCDHFPEWRPICGSDDVTYRNAYHLLCAQQCGIDVKVKTFFACQESNVEPEITTDISHERVTTSTTIKPEMTYKPLDVTINPELIRRLYKIPTTTEFPNVQTQGLQLSTTTTRPTTQITIPPAATTTRSTRKIISYNRSEFLKCVKLCQVTSEYSPVCGSNFVTYTNPGSLICARRCGLSVDILLRSPCPPNIAKISSTTQLPSTITTAKTTTKTAKTTTTTARTTTTTAKTTTTTARTTTKTVNRKSKTKFATLAQQQCIQSCDNSTEWRPVCGSNDVTYRNAYRLSCAQQCGIDVSLKKLSICMHDGSELTSSTTLKNTETAMDATVKYICVTNCDVTSEFNPVCGTDNITYKNPSFVQCLTTCGTGIQIKHRYPCSQENKTDEGVNTSTLSNIQPTTPKKSSQEICIDECFKNKEYKPVCGSNNVTYTNIEHLKCAQVCQVDVKLETYVPCRESSAESEITNNENPKKVLPTSTTNELERSNKPIGDVTDPESIKRLFNTPTTTESDKKVKIDLRSHFTHY